MSLAGGGSFVWVSVELEVDSVALQGTLDSFSLPDVLRLLAGTGKSGCLQVEGDRGEGNVWVEAGAIVAARAERALDDASIDEVVFELLRYGDGSFRFAADEKAPEPDEPHEVDHALRNATELLNEWRELEAVVPSLAHRVRIAPELTVDQVTVDAERWKTLVAMATGPSVDELGSALSQGELAVSRTVSDLVELGVAVVEEPNADAPQRGEMSTSSRATGATRRPRAERKVPERGTAEPAASANDEALRSANLNGQRTQSDRRPDRREQRNRRERDTRAPSSPAARASENGTDEAPQSGGSAPANGKLPRRSRTTGQRSGAGRGAGQGRPLGANGAASVTRPGPSGPAATQATPPSSPFANGSVLPSQGLPPGPEAIPSSRTAAPLPTSTSGGLVGLPPFDNHESAGLPGGSALDAGLLGPSPLPPTTGQVPMVAASSLPPDLSWAAEDDDAPLGGPRAIGGAEPPVSPPLGTPPPVPPAPPSAHPQLMNTGRSPLAVPGPHDEPLSPRAQRANSVGPIGDGETAAHVAVMSPDARHAVESIIGPSGGGSGVVPAAGATPEESSQRGALLGFLASVRST